MVPRQVIGALLAVIESHIILINAPFARPILQTVHLPLVVVQFGKLHQPRQAAFPA
jgi:hypothetical protein